MADSPCGPPEYGAATAYCPPIAPTLSDELSRFLPSSTSASHELLDEYNSSDYDADWRELGHDDDYINIEALLRPALLRPSADEILGNGSPHDQPSAVQPPSSTSCGLQASTTCKWQPQVCERSPSLTNFADPDLPPLKVDVQLQGLPAPAEYMAYIDLPHPRCNTRGGHIPQDQPNADFSFHPNLINAEPFGELCSSEASAVSDLPLVSADIPPASAMDTHNHPNADGARKIPKLAVGGPSQYLQSTGYPYANHSCLGNLSESPMSYVKKFSGSVAMEFSTASATSTSLTYQTSMDNILGVSISAPVSVRTPSVNKGAPNIESFHIKGSVPGGNLQVQDGLQKTDFYKLQDKFAWRKHHGLAEGGIRKRRKCSSTTSQLPMDPLSPPYSSSENTRRITDAEDTSWSFTNDKDDTVLIKVKTEKLKLDDGYGWRKYGEKLIRGENFSRNYLRCEESKRSGCTVLKHTQRCSDDEDYVHFLYMGKHNHPAVRAAGVMQ